MIDTLKPALAYLRFRAEGRPGEWFKCECRVPRCSAAYRIVRAEDEPDRHSIAVVGGAELVGQILRDAGGDLALERKWEAGSPNGRVQRVEFIALQPELPL